MSVQEIVSAIDALVNTGSSYMDRIDVSFAVADCLSSKAEMLQLYNTDGYDPSLLEKLKGICNANYIRLEYALVFLDEQHSNYVARTEVVQLYNKIKELLVLKNTKSEDKLEILSLYRTVSGWRLNSCESSFNYQLIDVDGIKSQVKAYEKEYMQ